MTNKAPTPTSTYQTVKNLINADPVLSEFKGHLMETMGIKGYTHAYNIRCISKFHIKRPEALSETDWLQFRKAKFPGYKEDTKRSYDKTWSLYRKFRVRPTLPSTQGNGGNGSTGPVLDALMEADRKGMMDWFTDKFTWQTIRREDGSFLTYMAEANSDPTEAM